MVEIIVATPEHAGAILDIYTPYILHTPFTFETELPTVDAMKQRIANCLQKFPWLVCVVGGSVAGYVYASSHRDRDAYQWTCECSVYVHEKFKGLGIARELYRVLFSVLKWQGLRNVYAGITLPNEPSVQLHEKCGFELFATYEHVGYKLGQWQKVGWWGLQINDYDPQPAPPIKFSEMDPGLLKNISQEAVQRIQSRITC